MTTPTAFSVLSQPFAEQAIVARMLVAAPAEPFTYASLFACTSSDILPVSPDNSTNPVMLAGSTFIAISGDATFSHGGDPDDEYMCYGLMLESRRTPEMLLDWSILTEPLVLRYNQSIRLPFVVLAWQQA